MLRDFAAVAAVTRAAKTMTARHAPQSLWRIGLADPDRAALVVNALERRFRECVAEKNPSLVRSDAVTFMRRLVNSLGDKGIEARALALIDSEIDLEAQRKQRTGWKIAATT